MLQCTVTLLWLGATDVGLYLAVRTFLLSLSKIIKLNLIQELINCGVSQQKTVLNTCGTGRAERTQSETRSSAMNM